VYRGDQRRRHLALTFDDGPSPSTPALLRVLEEFRVPATFFMCGTHVRRLESVAREVLDAGHELGNHTDTHPHLWQHSPAANALEIERAQHAIITATGIAPVLFRAPYGVRWFGLRRVQRRFGLMGVMWTVIGRDWVLDSSEVARLVIGRASNGGIICLHDGRELASDPDITTTIEAARRVVPALLDRGYEFRTVSDILCPTT
jgi:peptidoglycan/xylan/chitin deacetylase (PgdA/CDA1 family)